MTMPSVIFNGATISFDSPVDLYIIRGKLVIDTDSYGQIKETKVKAKKTKASHAPTTGLTQFLREAKLRIGKKIVVKSNSKKSIYGAYKNLGYTASIQDTDTPNEYLVTCRK